MFYVFQEEFKFVSKIIMIFALFVFINKSKLINIDNLINESLYQEDLDFSKLETDYKILAIFYPYNYYNIIDFIDEKITEIFNTENKEINFSKLIVQQVKIAKNHGLYGFGIVYDLNSDLSFNDEIFNLFVYHNMNNFPFFIILNNIEIFFRKEKISLIQNSKNVENGQIFLIESIKKYLTSKNYIKIRGKYILGIIKSALSSKFIDYISKKEIVNGKEKIEIIIISLENNIFEYFNSTYSFFEFPSKEIWLEKNLTQKYFYNFYYYNLFIEANTNYSFVNNFFVMNECQPEKFYITFKRYLNLSNDKKDKYILINAWNDFKEKLYLEPNKELGFSYLNYLSKAIFNINDKFVYNLDKLKNRCKIAIQIHLFYENLIKDIINKTNNIPVKFDLYISIVFPESYNNLNNYIKSFSKANYFELLIVENKGRDVLPFLNQFKSKFKYYKYLCHLHTKKTKKIPEIGFLWRNYLFNNLLGNSNIIYKILYDFENNKKLGFIFPETFYGIIKYFYKLTKENKKWIDFLVSKMFTNCKIGNQLNYPAGNMFWAKIAAIYQIFTYDFNQFFPNEKNQTDDTIMHGIERIWLYLVKYNHFFYKMIFQFF